MTRVINPDFPIVNERYTQLQADNPVLEEGWDSDRANFYDWSPETSWFEESCDWFKRPDLLKWHLKGLKLYTFALGSPEEGRKACRELIEKSNDQAGEAHVCLAMNAESLEEALSEFRQAKRIGMEVVDWEHEEAVEAVQSHSYWDHPGLRTVQRAQMGIALTLCKMERWQESKEAYDVLWKEMDRGAPKSYSSYINWRYHYPLVLMQLEDWEGALKFMEGQKDCFLLQSTQISWTWNITLCQLKLRKVRGIDGRYWDADLPQHSHHTQESSIGMNVRMAQSNPHLWKLLRSYRPGCKKHAELPHKRICALLPVTDSEEQAYVYWNRHRSLWEKSPDAIETVIRIRNRFLVTVLFQTDERGRAFTMGHIHPKLSLQHEDKVFALLRKWLNEGTDLSPVPGANTVTNLVTAKGVPTYTLAKYLAELSRHHYALDDINQMGLTPLNVACYYASNGTGGGAIISVLLQSGINPWVVPPRGQLSPAEMAANQGNWLAIKTILNHTDPKPRPQQLSELFLHMVGSSVFLCRTGRRPDCQRCAHDQAHDPGVSFEKCVECLAAYGLEPRHVVDQSLNAMAMMKIGLGAPHIKSHPLYRLLSGRAKQRDRLMGKYTTKDPSPQVEPLKCCHSCGGTRAIKLCSQCKERVFCSRYCQVRDWPTHKPHCQPKKA